LELNGGVSVEALTFGYGRRALGKGLSFSVHRGEALCLLGANGSGKTTLFKTLLGLLPVLGGRIAFNGQSIEHWPARKRAGVFGYVPQSGAGIFPFTVREMVMMGRTAHRGVFQAPTPADSSATDSALESLGITNLAGRDWSRISGGERQLVLVARALAQQPQALILDEPTANLDFGNQLRVIEQVKRLAESGMAVLFSTHHPEQAFACAARVALLHRGEFVSVGRPDVVITSETMKQLYGIDIDVINAGRIKVCVAASSQSASDGDLPAGRMADSGEG
jgi:iron complex transport system ATP-binding protein